MHSVVAHCVFTIFETSFSSLEGSCLCQAMSSVGIGVESDFNKITPKLLIQASTFSAGGNVILDEGFNAKLCGVHI